jgi:hypothetical protein
MVSCFKTLIFDFIVPAYKHKKAAYCPPIPEGRYSVDVYV